MSLGEFEFIDWLRSEFNQEQNGHGPGDDCAVLPFGDKQLLLTVDAVQEGRHFHLDPSAGLGYCTAQQVGRKSILTALSDIAAMGGWPRGALVSLAVPRNEPGQLRQELMRGIAAACRDWEIPILGGETNSCEQPGVTVSITVVGEQRLGTPVLRSGAQPGDRLYVTGELGGSLLERHHQPSPRLHEGEWLAKAGVHAMIDLSDGLSGDLWHLCRESVCGAWLRYELPISSAAIERSRQTHRPAIEHALHDGEDFELLFAISPDNAPRLKDWPFATKLTCVGEATEYRGETGRRAYGSGLTIGPQREPLSIASYDHFKRQPE